MFIRRCRLLIKRIYNALVMFKEENLAAAQIAQIFGSELLKVEQSAVTDSGQQPSIVSINPKQFLVGTETYTANKKAEERRLLQQLQREAEAAYPTALEQPSAEQRPALVESASAEYIEGIKRKPKSSNLSPVFANENTHGALERIACSLELIASSIANLTVVSKQKKYKKRTKSKTNLLNETTS